MDRIARGISLLAAFLMAAVVASSTMTGVAFADNEDGSPDGATEETTNRYEFSGGFVENLRSGEAQYDAQSKTLTLTDANAYMIRIDTNASITIDLAGTNKTDCFSSEYSPTITINNLNL